MTEKIIIEHNTTTGEIVEREMTPAELEAQAAMQAQAEEAHLAQEEAASALAALKASARAKLVAGTPLTEEEAATLVI
jgi:hypothetical protein